MSAVSAPSYQLAQAIGESCLCLRVQRASRVIGRRFDAALRPAGITNGQFSLLMLLRRPSPLTVGELAGHLAMDRTTLTANLKPLERRGLIKIRRHEKDARVRQIVLTKAGRALLARAVRYWRSANDVAKIGLGSTDIAFLHSALRSIAARD
jgi:DNA-binding MarR family transcriptional regulator